MVLIIQIIIQIGKWFLINNLNIFNTKDYDYYMNASESNNFDSFTLKNWIDLTNFGNLILKNIFDIQYKITDDNIKVLKKFQKSKYK